MQSEGVWTGSIEHAHELPIFTLQACMDSDNTKVKIRNSNIQVVSDLTCHRGSHGTPGDVLHDKDTVSSHSKKVEIRT